MLQVNLTSDPSDTAGGAAFECVHKSGGVGFTIELLDKPVSDTTFTYKIVGVRDGTGTIPSGVRSYAVTAAGVLATSFIHVTLTSDPGEVAGGAVLQSVTKSVGTGFTIQLTNATQFDTTFDYMLEVRSGSGTIPTGVDLYYIADATVAADSAVDVAFTGDPSESAGGTAVQEIYLSPGYGFTMKLTAPAQCDTTFDYIIG
jgi:hypothetical protein